MIAMQQTSTTDVHDWKPYIDGDDQCEQCGKVRRETATGYQWLVDGDWIDHEPGIGCGDW